MREMFQSATLKLTSWYLLTIMVISMAFSVAIYHFAMGEISARFDVVQSEVEKVPILSLPHEFFTDMRLSHYDAASRSILIGLLYVNLAILVGGGVVSYILARHTLRPIEEANQAQSRFVADASHQLRTPLAIMKAELETAQRSKTLSSEDAANTIQSTLEEVDRLSRLSSRLLSLSQFDDKVAERKLETVELDKLLKKTIAPYNKASGQIKLRVSGKVKVQARPEDLEELIEILIDNALKYSYKNSTIQVRLKRVGGKAEMSVANKGRGIPRDELSRIFDRFYRSSNSSRDSGYGLGLSIAKRIVESYFGEIVVFSKPGGLTKFTVKLPL